MKFTNIANFYHKFLDDNLYARDAILLAENQSKLVDQFFAELDEAIKLFNLYSKGRLTLDFDREILINTNKLITILDGKMELPVSQTTFEDLLSDKSLQKSFIREFQKFEFLVEIGNLNKLLANIIVASYRTYMLEKYPFLKRKNAQVASALEEMFAIMALQDKKIQLFRATKHWIMDWKIEGFSKRLADKIVNI